MSDAKDLTKYPYPNDGYVPFAYNVKKIDDYVNSPNETTDQRLGVEVPTWTGLCANIRRAILNIGFTEVEYSAGNKIETLTQFVIAPDGQAYSILPSVALPYTITGDWVAEKSNFKLVGDQSLRNDFNELKKNIIYNYVIPYIPSQNKSGFFSYSETYPVPDLPIGTYQYGSVLRSNHYFPGEASEIVIPHIMQQQDAMLFRPSSEVPFRKLWDDHNFNPNLKLNSNILTQTSGQSSDLIMSQKAVTNNIFGLGQTLRDNTLLAGFDTVYTNTSGRTRFIFASFLNASSGSGFNATLELITSGVGIYTYGGGSGASGTWKGASLCSPILPGEQYRFRRSDPSVSFVSVIELV